MRLQHACKCAPANFHLKTCIKQKQKKLLTYVATFGKTRRDFALHWHVRILCFEHACLTLQSTKISASCSVLLGSCAPLNAVVSSEGQPD